MSGIAEVLLGHGFSVSGSDMASTATTQRLQKLGARIFLGHRASQIEGATCVVVSSAVVPENPEWAAARSLRIPVIPRAEMLAELMRLKMGITIAGSHGKTTTTSMVGQFIRSMDPTVVVGGRLQHWNASSVVGKGSAFVIEADESDRSFLKFSPVYSVVTNIDREHMDTYSDLNDLKDTFLDFLNRTAFFGMNWISADCSVLRSIKSAIVKPTKTYGYAEDADLRITESRFEGRRSFFKLELSERPLGEFELSVVGHHNIKNATAAIGLALSLDVSLEEVRDHCKSFIPADRRLQVHYESAELALVEDYGHHPTEIEATLLALRLMYPSRKIHTFFQPHRYSRTESLWGDFAASFENKTDELYLLPIYAAHEQPIKGIDSESLATTFKTLKPKVLVAVPTVDEVMKLISDFDSSSVILILGAGPLTSLAVGICKSLQPQTIESVRA